LERVHERIIVEMKKAIVILLVSLFKYFAKPRIGSVTTAYRLKLAVRFYSSVFTHSQKDDSADGSLDVKVYFMCRKVSVSGRAHPTNLSDADLSET
jgi:hypothetical protein